MARGEFLNIAKLIRQKRLKHSTPYSQNQLSSDLGYSNGQFVSNIERGLCSTPMNKLADICRLLNITPIEMKKALLADMEDALNKSFKSKKEPIINSRSPRA